MFQHNFLRVLLKYSWNKLRSLCIALLQRIWFEPFWPIFPLWNFENGNFSCQFIEGLSIKCWLNRKYFSVQMRTWLNTTLAQYFLKSTLVTIPLLGNFLLENDFQHNFLRVLQKYSWHKLCSLCIAKFCSAYDLSDLYFSSGTLKKEIFLSVP